MCDSEIIRNNILLTWDCYLFSPSSVFWQKTHKSELRLMMIVSCYHMWPNISVSLVTMSRPALATHISDRFCLNHSDSDYQKLRIKWPPLLRILKFHFLYKTNHFLSLTQNIISRKMWDWSWKDRLKLFNQSEWLASHRIFLIIYCCYQVSHVADAGDLGPVWPELIQHIVTTLPAIKILIISWSWSGLVTQHSTNSRLNNQNIEDYHAGADHCVLSISVSLPSVILI